MPRREESQYSISSPGKTQDHKSARGPSQFSMNPPSFNLVNQDTEFPVGDREFVPRQSLNPVLNDTGDYFTGRQTTPALSCTSRQSS